MTWKSGPESAETNGCSNHYIWAKAQILTLVYVFSLTPSVLRSSWPQLFPEHPQLRTFALAGPCASDALSGNHLPTRTPLTHHHIGEVFLGDRVASTLACSLCFIQNEPVSQTVSFPAPYSSLSSIPRYLVLAVFRYFIDSQDPIWSVNRYLINMHCWSWCGLICTQFGRCI